MRVELRERLGKLERLVDVLDLQPTGRALLAACREHGLSIDGFRFERGALLVLGRLATPGLGTTTEGR